jgi:SAM-dependent methyltransferase
MDSISQESVQIFTETPHADSSLDALQRYIEKSFVGPSFKKGTWLNRNLDLTGKTVLDAGCGSGLKSLRLARVGPKKVVGVDGSPVAIGRARALASRLKLENAVFVEGFLEDLDAILAREGIVEFDFILSSQNIHHVTEWMTVLTSYARFLAPGGCLSVIWVDPWRGRSGFMVKNKISYWLGKTPAQRIKIGRRLFGWRDRKFNVMNLEWDAYYADRYAAFYHWIPLRRMRRVLERAGLEIVDAVPPSNALFWAASMPDTGWRKPVKRMVKQVPLFGALFTFALRLSQFLRYGDTRTLVARKPTSS